jgi:hypothetical protein
MQGKKRHCREESCFFLGPSDIGKKVRRSSDIYTDARCKSMRTPR